MFFSRTSELTPSFLLKLSIIAYFQSFPISYIGTYWKRNCALETFDFFYTYPHKLAKKDKKKRRIVVENSLKLGCVLFCFSILLNFSSKEFVSWKVNFSEKKYKKKYTRKLKRKKWGSFLRFTKQYFRERQNFPWPPCKDRSQLFIKNVALFCPRSCTQNTKIHFLLFLGAWCSIFIHVVFFPHDEDEEEEQENVRFFRKYFFLLAN